VTQFLRATTLAIALAFTALTACSRGDAPAESAPLAPASYVGATVCAECHDPQWQAWRESDHDLALQQVGPESVLADFPSRFQDAHFSRTGDQFLIQPDADTPAMTVQYTFGVTPLQQYVVEVELGRLQVLPVPWDTRDASGGGQRWYELYPGDFPADDPMHWRGRANGWNAMCADCHSTAVKKGYDPASHSYTTTFAEEDVACEACHGPGSRHVDAARVGSPLGSLLADVSSQQGQINACAQCHSRRTQFREGFEPGQSFFDFYQPSLLRAGLYHDDGQILDEVYVYGSFLQSKMHLQGVTCSHCHDSHSTALKFEGDAVCTQCHNSAGRPDLPTLKAGLYDDPEHHFHPSGSNGSACISCHMTAMTYMGVDVRNDHSFRLPRPDLTEQIGVPNACNSCHSDQSAAWASKIVQAQFGERPDHYGTLFAAARGGDANAESYLVTLAADENQPVMVRATALSLLSNVPSGDSLATMDALYQAKEEHPLLRLGTTFGAAGLSPQRQWQLVSPLLDDDLMAIRVAAFTALLSAAADPQINQQLRPHLPAYLATQALTLDFPETQVNVANAYMRFGDAPAAEFALQEAIALQPSFVPALLNLADLYRATERDADGEELLVRAMAIAPDVAEPVFSYAMWLTRQQHPDALDYIRRAADLAPNQIRYGYTLAIALKDSGRANEAIGKLESMLEEWPDNQDLLYVLALILRDQGRDQEALLRVEQLLIRNPRDQRLQLLQEQLQ